MDLDVVWMENKRAGHVMIILVSSINHVCAINREGETSSGVYRQSNGFFLVVKLILWLRYMLHKIRGSQAKYITPHLADLIISFSCFADIPGTQSYWFGYIYRH